MLSDVAKIYDPLGLISPVTVTLKICLQDVWRLNLWWDDELPPEATKNFLDWRAELPRIRTYTIPRCVTLPNLASAQIHVFCDASQVAYGAVLYIRAIALDGEVKTTMLTSKTKVAPLKTQSIPRLELCAALLGTRLVNSVKESLQGLNIEFEVYAWTDSEVVLQWLNSHSGRWQTYVANRTSEILESIPRPHWKHVPTEQNPADCTSRGLSVQDFMEHKLFRDGPTFIGQNFVIPPQIDERSGTPHEERIRPPLLAAVGIDGEPQEGILALIRLKDFSSLKRAVKVLTIVRRYVARLRERALKGQRKGPKFQIDLQERANSLKLIVLAVQQKEFPEELELLRQGHNVPKKSKLFRLYPFVDGMDGLLKVGGRLAFVESIPEHTRFPSILPKGCRLSTLLGRQYHEQTLHGGLHLCLAELRQSFWIISARTLIRQIIRNCVTCFRYNSS
jgi:hypothetical protein